MSQNIPSNGGHAAGSIQIKFFGDEFSFGCVAKQEGSCVSCRIFISEEILPESSLVVEYCEKSHAVNKIPGGFNKREAKNRESEIFSGRMIMEALQGTVDQNFRRCISAYVNVETYAKNCPIEALAITALSALFRHAGVPSFLIAAETVSYVKDSWKCPANDSGFLLVSACHQGVTSFSYHGPELSPQVLAKGASEAFHFACEKIEQIYRILPETRCNWIAEVAEQHAFPYDPKAIGEIFLANKNDELAEKKHFFLSKWEDKKLGAVRWNAAIRQILKAYLGWQKKRLGPREFNEAANVVLDSDIIKHSSGIAATKGSSASFCYCSVSSSANEAQIIDSYKEMTRKFIVHVDNMGRGSGKEEVFESVFIRNALKNQLADERFIRLVVENFMTQHPFVSTALSGCMNALKLAGIKMSGQVSGGAVGIVLNSGGNRFLLDVTLKEQEYMTDSCCWVAGTEQGFSVVSIFNSAGTVLPLTIVNDALNFSARCLEPGKYLEPDKEVENKKKGGYTITFANRSSKLKEIKDNLGRLQEKLGCTIRVSDKSVLIEAENASEMVDDFVREFYSPSEEGAQVFYAKVEKLDEKTAYFKLLDGREGKLKRDNLKKDVNDRSEIIAQLKKGRYWSFLDLI